MEPDCSWGHFVFHQDLIQTGAATPDPSGNICKLMLGLGHLPCAHWTQVAGVSSWDNKITPSTRKLRNIDLYLPSSTWVLEFCLFCLPSFLPSPLISGDGESKIRKNILSSLIFVAGQRESGRCGSCTSCHGTMGISDAFWLLTGLESCPRQAESQLLLLEKVEPELESRVLG